MSGEMRDERRLPFFMVTKPATAALASAFSGRRLPTARSIYFAIVELANDARAETFAKPRKVIAERAGVNVRVLDEYVPEIESAGLLRVDRVSAEGVNLPNRWTLTDPPCASVGGSDPADATPSDPADTRGSGPACTPLKEGTTSQKQEGKEVAERTGAIEAVWTHYQQTVPNGTRYKLDSSRRLLICKALKVRDVDECCGAIDGLATSDYHVQHGYLDIKYALRGGGHSPSVEATIDRLGTRSPLTRSNGMSELDRQRMASLERLKAERGVA